MGYWSCHAWRPYGHTQGQNVGSTREHEILRLPRRNQTLAIALDNTISIVSVIHRAEMLVSPGSTKFSNSHRNSKHIHRVEMLISPGSTKFSNSHRNKHPTVQYSFIVIVVFHCLFHGILTLLRPHDFLCFELVPTQDNGSIEKFSKKVPLSIFTMTLLPVTVSSGRFHILKLFFSLASSWPPVSL